MAESIPDKYSKYTLTSRTPLAGFSRSAEGIALAEVSGLGIVSIATPNGGEHSLTDAVNRHYGASLPAPGESTTSAIDNARFLGLAADQRLLLFDDPTATALATVSKRLQNVAYLTDQSDGWAILRLSGPQARNALERLCPVDLHADTFSIGAVASTAMEHLRTVIFRYDVDSFVLLSAASSAQTFLHAVQVSVRNTLL